MKLGTRDVLLGVSLVGNLLLGAALIIALVVMSGVAGNVIPTQKEGEQIDRLVLQLRCGDGDKGACEQSLDEAGYRRQ